MAVVLTIAQQKGGAGKTMLAANLAAHWAAAGRRIGLLDIDPQGSLSRWHALRAGRPAIAHAQVSGWRLAGELDRLAQNCDILLVDTPPQIDNDARRAIRQATLVLVPLQPSAPDLWAAEGTLALATAERRAVLLLLNRAAARSRLRTDIEAEIGRRGLRLLGAALASRSAYAVAFARGMGVSEAAPRSAAAVEFANFADGIEQVIKELRR